MLAEIAERRGLLEEQLLADLIRREAVREVDVVGEAASGK
jgi:hypothetical protein